MLKKVYIIDDDEITLYLTQVIFELFSPQCECICFDNALEALACLEKDNANHTFPDLILLDLNMPFMSGFELLKKLEPMGPALLARPCFIYILSSSVDEQDRSHSLKCPLVTNLIQKPLTQEKLKEIKGLLTMIK